MEAVFHINQTPKLVAVDFADYLKELISETDVLHIALSGGSTPALLFDILSQKYKYDLDWNKIHFYWGDERCVPPDHPESNYKMTWEHLLKHISIPSSNIHRIQGEKYPRKEVKRYVDEIISGVPLLNGLPQFDIIMLGLGTDGHTASIFPDQMELLKSSEIYTVAVHPDSGQNRITLTGPVINAARSICFLVTGESKKRKITEIINREGSWEKYPATYIKPEKGTLHWFLDENAAAGL